MKVNKNIISGLIFIGMGLSLPSENGGFYVYGRPVPSIAKYIIYFLGICLIILGIKNKHKQGTEYYKCPKCLYLKNKGFTSKNICPKCKSVMEQLEGFYDRHPELRDSRK